MNITQNSRACSLIRQKMSLKVVLLHDGSRFHSFPLAHAANMKESCDSMKVLLGKFNCDEFKWKLRGDLKVVALLVGKQQGYTKYCCLMCKWYSRDMKNHPVNKRWPKRTSLTPGEKNNVNRTLVISEKIYLPPKSKSQLLALVSFAFRDKILKHIHTH